MYISYKEFCELLLKHVYSGENFYLKLLTKVIDNPERYCGLFRVSNPKVKVLQNVTQSNEIKFGQAIEELTTEYIKKMGYKTFDKNLGKDDEGKNLRIDQYFSDGNKIFAIEMKIRDDHDSSNKAGQYDSFRKKINLITKTSNKNIDAILWFVDDNLIKNRKFYSEKMEKEKLKNCEFHLYYGREFFLALKNGEEAWNEFVDLLAEYRNNNTSNEIDIPDFGTSEEIYNALLNLSKKYWKKLISDDPKYILLRKELFSSGDNLEKAKKNRK